MKEFSKVEYCVIDKTGNNVEVFNDEYEAIEFAQNHNYPKVLEVGYGEPDEHGDEVELYATEVWNIEEDGELYEGTAYYDVKFKDVADTIETNDFSEVESWAWNMLQQGLYIEIKNYKSGKSQRLTPDDVDDNGLDIDIQEAYNRKLSKFDNVVKVLDDYGILYGDVVENDDGSINIVGVDESEWEETRDAIESELHLEVLVPDYDHEEYDDELIVK